METEVTSASSKSSISAHRIPMVLDVSPGMDERTSGIVPLKIDGSVFSISHGSQKYSKSRAVAQLHLSRQSRVNSIHWRLVSCIDNGPSRVHRAACVMGMLIGMQDIYKIQICGHTKTTQRPSLNRRKCSTGKYFLFSCS